MLWNIRTVNEIKQRKMTEIINYMGYNEVRKDVKDKKESNSVVIDIIVLVEYGKRQIKFKTFNLKGYELYSISRDDRKGGGIALYVKNNINVNVKLSTITKDYEIIIR